jgi:phage terminase large subunit-like protein
VSGVVTSPPDELAVFGRFCAALRLEDGRPFLLEPFELVLLTDYFSGALETLVLLPKKNGKTTLLAALALYHLLVTPDAECVIGAASRDQATILYDQACGFVYRSPELQDRVAVKRGYREIRSRRDQGRIRVLAADVDTADGVIPTLALVDELHRHRSADLYGVFRDGLGPRRGRMVTISTAGDNELSPLGRMRTAARRLPLVERAGRYLYARAANGSYVLHEWALEIDDDVADMEVVKLANPASWQTTETLVERYSSPSTTPWQWARFACGLWVGAEPWWLRSAEWAACAVADRLEPGDRIALGFDGSQSGDATALVACRLSDGLVQPLGMWVAPLGADRDWQVPRGAVDAAMAAAMETYTVARAYCDPPLWQTEIDGWAREFGDAVVLRYDTNRVRMMAATERFRTDVMAGRLRHVEDEQLSAHVLSAQMHAARGGYWLAKSRPGSPDKIDLAVAAVLAYEARVDALAAKDDRRRPGRLLTF